jgi:hypothetical protein
LTTNNSQTDDEPDTTEEGTGSQAVDNRRSQGPDSGQSASVSPDGSLTTAALDALLNYFSSDPDEAARLYVTRLTKLERFFEWKHSRRPDVNARETLDRVARKILEGATITNLNSYIIGFAYKIKKEEDREESRFVDAERIIETQSVKPELEDDVREIRMQCLESCLAELAPETRLMIQEYFSADKRAKIELRKRMALRLGIAPNALRIRIHRIQKGLEQCVKACCKQRSDG